MAITQAICEYQHTPMAHSLSGVTPTPSAPALKSAVQVFAANGVTLMLDRDHGYTPTPVISHAIISYNQGRDDGHADGVVITPSHNPPTDGGFKYNPPHGGPADTAATTWIADRANELLAENNNQVESLYYPDALAAETTVSYGYVTPYVGDLKNVINMEAIVEATLHLCRRNGRSRWSLLACDPRYLWTQPGYS